jgi:signal transduction histidine kinase/DNA-binding response OmpR family regulator
MGDKKKAELKQSVRRNVILFVIFMLMMLAGVMLMRKQLLDNAMESGILLMDNYSNDEENIINTYKNLLKLSTRYVDEMEQNNVPIEEIKMGLYPYLDGFYDLYEGDNLRVIGIVDGTTISNIEEYEDIDVTMYDYKEASWYRGAIASDGEVYVSDAYEDNVTGKMVVTLSQKTAHYDSVLLFDLFFDDYHTGKNELDLPENAAYYLCDSKGTVLYYQSNVYDNYEDVQEFVDNMLPVFDNTEIYGYIDKYTDAKGCVRSAYRHITPSGWNIIMTVPQNNAVDGMTSMYIVMGILLLCGVCIITYMIVRDFTHEQRNHQLRLERQEMEEKNLIYQKSMRSTLLSYKEVCYIDLKKNTYQIIYPEKKSGQSGGFDEGMKSLVDRGTLISDDMDELRGFLNASYITDELKDKDYIEIRCRHREKDGTYETCTLSVTVVDRKSDGPESATFTIRSIEKIIRQEVEQRELLELVAKQAEAANHAKSDFLSNMSHDIRTPMNAIMGMTAIAAMHIDDKERVLDALNKITIAGKHLLGLINSVLDMSKIESGKISLSEEEFNLSDSVENLITLFHSQMKSKKLELKVNIASITHENVVGDSQRLSQIFVNIMGNAIKFTPEGGTVSIGIKEKLSGAADWGCYEFVFEDNGIGMEKSFIDKIFEPFARAADSRISGIEGTGLGMPIAVNIARMMGGDIKVESEPGKGSRFTVTVFLKINHSTPEDLQKLADLPVLVVDDEEDACISACEILNSLDMKAEYVLNGDDAVVKVSDAHRQENDFSVVILDWKMPGKDGIETAREIRKEVGDEVPIIILSAYDWRDIEQEALLAGVNAFIEKPLFKSRLTHVLKTVLSGEHVNILDNAEVMENLPKDRYSGWRVLLVDDNELNIEVGAEILEMTGLEVEMAHNGREAVDMVTSKPDGYYHMVFMDIQMPVMNGYEAVRAIRNSQREDLKTLPVIAMTADAFAEDVKRAMEAGMNSHISKPIDVVKLQKIIEEFS